MVHPRLEYVSNVWCPRRHKDIQLLEKGQHWAARYATNNYVDRSPGSVTSMLKNLKWSRLKQWRQQTRLGMLYKINNDLVDINLANIFHHSDPRTRGTQRLHQEQTQHYVLFCSFRRTDSEWNLLSMAVSSAPSPESLQSQLAQSLHNFTVLITAKVLTMTTC